MIRSTSARVAEVGAGVQSGEVAAHGVGAHPVSRRDRAGGRLCPALGADLAGGSGLAAGGGAAGCVGLDVDVHVIEVVLGGRPAVLHRSPAFVGAIDRPNFLFPDDVVRRMGLGSFCSG